MLSRSALGFVSSQAPFLLEGCVAEGSRRIAHWRRSGSTDRRVGSKSFALPRSHAIIDHRSGGRGGWSIEDVEHLTPTVSVILPVYNEQETY